MRNWFCFALLCATSLAVADEPQLHGNIDAARAIAKTDTDFAALAQKEGIAKAFRDTMDADEGKVFGGGGEPALGRDAIYALMGGDAPDKVTLEWAPVEAYAAKSGDFGVSRGRWTRTSLADKTKIVHGSYVTVWHKDAHGAWKGLIDIGNPDPPPPAQK